MIKTFTCHDKTFAVSDKDLNPYCLEYFNWKELPIIPGKEFIGLTHHLFGKMIKSVMNGNINLLEDIINVLVECLSEEYHFITLIWIQRIDLMLSLSVCLGEKQTLEVLKLLQDISDKNNNKKYIKYNILNPEVINVLKCVDIYNVKDKINVEEIPKDYIKYDGISVLFLPEEGKDDLSVFLNLAPML